MSLSCTVLKYILKSNATDIKIQSKTESVAHHVKQPVEGEK